jgi:hypothetical protein
MAKSTTSRIDRTVVVETGQWRNTHDPTPYSPTTGAALRMAARAHMSMCTSHPGVVPVKGRHLQHLPGEIERQADDQRWTDEVGCRHIGLGMVAAGTRLWPRSPRCSASRMPWPPWPCPAEPRAGRLGDRAALCAASGSGSAPHHRCRSYRRSTHPVRRVPPRRPDRPSIMDTRGLPRIVWANYERGVRGAG